MTVTLTNNSVTSQDSAPLYYQVATTGGHSEIS
jgi:hypothetical protein